MLPPFFLPLKMISKNLFFLFSSFLCLEFRFFISILLVVPLEILLCLPEPKLINHLFIFCFFFRAAPVAYGGSQARGLIGVAAASLRQSHSNARSEPRLQPTPQLLAMPDP